MLYPLLLSSNSVLRSADCLSQTQLVTDCCCCYCYCHFHCCCHFHCWPQLLMMMMQLNSYWLLLLMLLLATTVCYCRYWLAGCLSAPPMTRHSLLLLLLLQRRCYWLLKAPELPEEADAPCVLVHYLASPPSPMTTVFPSATTPMTTATPSATTPTTESEDMSGGDADLAISRIKDPGSRILCADLSLSRIQCVQAVGSGSDMQHTQLAVVNPQLPLFKMPRVGGGMAVAGGCSNRRWGSQELELEGLAVSNTHQSPLSEGKRHASGMEASRNLWGTLMASKSSWSPEPSGLLPGMHAVWSGPSAGDAAGDSCEVLGGGPKPTGLQPEDAWGSPAAVPCDQNQQVQWPQQRWQLQHMLEQHQHQHQQDNQLRLQLQLQEHQQLVREQQLQLQHHQQLLLPQEGKESESAWPSIIATHTCPPTSAPPPHQRAMMAHAMAVTRNTDAQAVTRNSDATTLHQLGCSGQVMGGGGGMMAVARGSSSNGWVDRELELKVLAFSDTQSPLSEGKRHASGTEASRNVWGSLMASKRSWSWEPSGLLPGMHAVWSGPSAGDAAGDSCEVLGGGPKPTGLQPGDAWGSPAAVPCDQNQQVQQRWQLEWPRQRQKLQQHWHHQEQEGQLQLQGQPGGQDDGQQQAHRHAPLQLAAAAAGMLQPPQWQADHGHGQVMTAPLPWMTNTTTAQLQPQQGLSAPLPPAASMLQPHQQRGRAAALPATPTQSGWLLSLNGGGPGRGGQNNGSR